MVANLNKLQHQPWVGDLFPTTAQRLMVLGESHHGDDQDEMNMTIPVVEEWLSGISCPSYRLFTHLAVALTGQDPQKLDRKAVFRRIAFYNYVGKVMPASRVAPTRDDFVQSERGFREVVERLKPTHIIVCGKRLWEAMPQFDPPDSNGYYAVFADMEFHVGRYRTTSAAPLAITIRHPQSGFNGLTWHPRVQAFLST